MELGEASPWKTWHFRTYRPIFRYVVNCLGNPTGSFIHFKEACSFFGVLFRGDVSSDQKTPVGG